MSYQAMEAVQDCTAVDDPTGYNVFYAIARYADVSGSTADGKLKAPNIDTLAEKAHCHRNTVLNWIKRLEELKVLSVERKGQGRGSYNVYHILLDIKEKSDTTPFNDTSMDVPIDQKNSTPMDVLIALNNGLSEMREMVQETREMVQAIKLMVHEMVQNGTSKDGLDTSIHLDTYDTSSFSSPTGEGTADEPTEEIAEEKQTVKPYQVYQQLLELEPGMKKGQSLREIKVMLSGNGTHGPYPPEDIIGCGRFLQTDPWRINNMVTLSTQTILEKLPKWIASGRPRDWDTFQASQNGHHGRKAKPRPAAENPQAVASDPNYRSAW